MHFRIAKIEDGTHYLDRITNDQGEILISDLEPGVYSVKETATTANHIIDLREYHVELFLCHRLDPTRPTTMADVFMLETDSPILEIPDVNSYNLYFG